MERRERHYLLVSSHFAEYQCYDLKIFGEMGVNPIYTSGSNQQLLYYHLTEIEPRSDSAQIPSNLGENILFGLSLGPK